MVVRHGDVLPNAQKPATRKRYNMKKLLAMAVVAALMVLSGIVWLIGASNPETPAGYVGYLTQGALFGKAKFYDLQTGPTSPGRTWLLHVLNVSITPYTYDQEFYGNESVLSKDNLKIGFRVHIIWKVNRDRIKDFVEHYTTIYDDKNPDKVVQDAYNNFLREPLRTYARDEIQRLNGLEVKDKITPTGDAVFARVLALTKNTPFEVMSVVVGNIQYPEEVASAVSRKMATTQVLEQKVIELKVEEQKKAIRIVEAEGIAKAMEIIHHPSQAHQSVPSARGHRSPEGHGGIAKPHDSLHPRRPDGLTSRRYFRHNKRPAQEVTD